MDDRGSQGVSRHIRSSILYPQSSFFLPYPHTPILWQSLATSARISRGLLQSELPGLSSIPPRLTASIPPVCRTQAFIPSVPPPRSGTYRTRPGCKLLLRKIESLTIPRCSEMQGIGCESYYDWPLSVSRKTTTGKFLQSIPAHTVSLT